MRVAEKHLKLIFARSYSPDIHTVFLPKGQRKRSKRSVLNRCKIGCLETFLRQIRRSSSSEIWRSEEHTSELQSRENLVCRLLLEKKKVNIQNKRYSNKE